MSGNVKRFGTFSGVFVTNVLTIFGVILFYREGWVVGNAGLLGGIAIILLANSVTLTTALSISAIATNIKVKGGGTYYIISRSLGPEIGGAIGVTLFFAQAFSIAFYIIGFTLSLKMFFPAVDIRILNTATLLIITLIAIIDAGLAIKVQYVVFAMIMLAIGSFFLGNMAFDVEPVYIGKFANANFWKTFAIFFPAVTGILAGVSLSGDLKDPAKNIPLGTILSVVFTMFFYLLVAVFFAFNIPENLLLSDEKIIYSSSKFPIIILLGIWCATLSSALGSILGAPRTLQALANDRIIPAFFAKGSGKNNEPRRAIIFSVILAEGLLLLGDINFVAELLTMFFLSSYGIVNVITAIETIIKNPAYRPLFKVHWAVSLYGAVSSFIIMFLINKPATVIAIVIISILYFYLSRKNYDMNWGDVRKRFWASLIDFAVKNYEKYAEHPRNWKPNVALFENSVNNREVLLNIGSLIASRNGLVSYYIFNESNILDVERRNSINNSVDDYFKQSGLQHVYPKTIFTNKDNHSHMITLQADGIASYRSNTIISDFNINDKSLEAHFFNLSCYDTLKKSVVLIKNTDKTEMYNDRIDIWISGFKANISLMLLLPFLITKDNEWKNSKVYIRMVVRDKKLKETAQQNLESILKSARIQVIPVVTSLDETDVIVDDKEEEVILNGGFIQKSRILTKLQNFLSNVDQSKYEKSDRDKIINVIKETSSSARMVIMGLNIPDKGKESDYAANMLNIVKDLPLTLLVKGNEDINLFR